MTAKGRSSTDETTERAEQMVDAAMVAVGQFISRVDAEVLKRVALAREEAEDILAEARYLANSDRGT